MKKLIIFFALILFTLSLHAENFSEMSTQELIQIMGYVKSDNKAKFERELQSRVSTMTQQERKEYQKNLEKLKKR